MTIRIEPQWNVNVDIETNFDNENGLEQNHSGM